MQFLKKKASQLRKSNFSKRIKRLIFKPLEYILRYQIEKYKFKQAHGYRLNLRNPRSFSEKIIYKKIHDRNPLLPIAADKHKVRDYVRERLGEKAASEILIPQLYQTEDPETIPFESLPAEYIIKANHGSGANIIVSKDSDIEKKEVVDTCKLWLMRPCGYTAHEWAYQSIERRIVIEKLIRNRDGDLPKDYKFHVINDEIVFIQVDYNRHSGRSIKRCVLNKNWEDIDARLKYSQMKNPPRPINLDEMERIALELSKPFDYIRVDLYNLNGKIYFGELTNYPGSGRAKIEPKSFDFELGERWNLKNSDYYSS